MQGWYRKLVRRFWYALDCPPTIVDGLMARTFGGRRRTLTRGLTITHGGAVARVAPSSLEDFQALVGGPIELFSLPRLNACMFINEDGKPRGCTYNPLATLVASTAGSLVVGDVIVGDVVIVGVTDRNGNNTDLPTDARDIIEMIAAGYEAAQHHEGGGEE